MSQSNIGNLTVKKICRCDKYGPAPRNDPLVYPGKYPSFSYLLYDDMIYSLTNEKQGDNTITLDQKLRDLSAPPIGERNMILGYGSNLNPSQLTEKFKDNDNPLIVLLTTLNHHDIVYMAKISKYGYVPAALEYSKDTQVNVGINLLDNEQLKTMNKTEGGYKLQQLNTKVNLCGNLETVKYYHAKDLLKDPNDSPIRLKNIHGTNTKYPAMTEEEVLDYVANMVNGIKGRELSNTIHKNNNDRLCQVNKFLKTKSIKTAIVN